MSKSHYLKQHQYDESPKLPQSDMSGADSLEEDIGLFR